MSRVYVLQKNHDGDVTFLTYISRILSGYVCLIEITDFILRYGIDKLLFGPPKSASAPYNAYVNFLYFFD